MPRVQPPDKIGGHRKLVVMTICIIMLLLIVGGVFWWIHYQQQREVTEYNALAVQLEVAGDHQDNAKIVSLITAYQQKKHSDRHLYDTDITLGYAYNSLGQYDKGIVALKRADDLKLDISNSFLHGTMGSYYASKGDKPQAIAEFQQGIADAKRDNDPTTAANAASYQAQITALEAKK